MQADEQARQETEAAENNLFRDDPSCQESLRADKPEDGHAVSGIVERNCGEHQSRANHAQYDESLAAAFGDGQLGQSKFERSYNQERDIVKLRLDGSEIHDVKVKEEFL